MGDVSSIEWTEATLNAWTGCRKVSAGCAHCYIGGQPPLRIAGRKWVKGQTLFVDKGAVVPGQTTPVVYHLDRIDKMVRRRKPTLYFVNSLSDVFLEDVPDEVIALLFAGMACAPQHTFQVLTKRPERMHELLTSDRWNGLLLDAVCGQGSDWRTTLTPGDPDAGPVVLPNVWLGVTVENVAQIGRADLLRDTPAAIRFLSCEPLLGPLFDVRKRCHTCRTGPDAIGVPGSVQPYGKYRDTGGAGCPDCEHGYRIDSLSLAGMDWVIGGGESGPRPRPCAEAWLRELRDHCASESLRRLRMPRGHVGELDEYPKPDPPCLFFLKQLGGHPDKRGGDKARLDGRLHHDMPPVRAAEPAGVT